jgi:hypothetical protein
VKRPFVLLEDLLINNYSLYGLQGIKSTLRTSKFEVFIIKITYDPVIKDQDMVDPKFN